MFLIWKDSQLSWDTLKTLLGIGHIVYQGYYVLSFRGIQGINNFMRFGYIWILFKDHLLSPWRRDDKGSEKFNLNLPVSPPPRLCSILTAPPFLLAVKFLRSPSFTLCQRRLIPPLPPSPLENHVIPSNPPTPTPLRRWWIVTAPLHGGKLRVQGEGVEGIGEIYFLSCR